MSFMLNIQPVLSYAKASFHKISYFQTMFSTLYVDFQLEFSTTHPDSKAIIVHKTLYEVLPD